MSTTPFNFNTPDRVIRFAMYNAGLIQDGDDPTSEQYANYMPRLNDVVNLAQTQGLKLWLNTDLAITLVAGQALYSMGPGYNVSMTKPMRVVMGYYLDSFNNSRPLLVISQEEYLGLSTRVQNGAINSYYVDKQQLSLNVYFWLTPDAQAATGSAHVVIQQQVTNVISINDSLNFPQEWFMFLHWALADEICTGQPQAIMERCATRAEQYRMALENWDVEDAPTMFAPDARSVYNSSNFT